MQILFVPFVKISKLIFHMFFFLNPSLTISVRIWIILYFVFLKWSVTFATFDFTLFSAQLSGWRASQVVFHESVPLTHIAPLSAWNPLFLFIGKNNGTVIIIKSSSISFHATCFIESEKRGKVWFSSWKQKNFDTPILNYSKPIFWFMDNLH